MTIKEVILQNLPADEDTLAEVTLLQAPAPTTWLTNSYITAATSANTRKAYRSDIQHYEMWGGKLPASSAAIVQYLEAFAATLNPRTLSRRLIALRHWHTYQQFPDPTAHPAIQKTMTGILRIHGKPKAKARALLTTELAHIAQHLEQEGSLAAVRDNVLLQMGFFGAFRRSELVGIHYEHVIWHQAGVEVLLPQSKTDQIHAGQYCALPYGNSLLCPVRALEAWLSLSAINSGPLFRRISLGDHLGQAALTALSINHILKNRATQAGITEVEALSSHSLRRGLATSAATAGAPLHTIMRAGRWKQTNTVMEYIESASQYSDNAARVVLTHLKVDK